MDSRLLKTAMTHPYSMFCYAKERYAMSQNKRHSAIVKQITTCDHDELMQTITGVSMYCFINSQTTIQFQLEKAKNRLDETYRDLMEDSAFSYSAVSLNDALVLYSIVRAIQPEFLVETGVSDGYSTMAILMALNHNRKGKLHSIDLPNVGKPQLIGKSPGWLVNDELRDRWQLYLGHSRKLLRSVIGDSKLDFFFHDSEHSYGNMEWELSVALSCANSRAVICCDDALSNDAFVESALKRKSTFRICHSGMGGFRL